MFDKYANGIKLEETTKLASPQILTNSSKGLILTWWNTTQTSMWHCITNSFHTHLLICVKKPTLPTENRRDGTQWQCECKTWGSQLTKSSVRFKNMGWQSNTNMRFGCTYEKGKELLILCFLLGQTTLSSAYYTEKMESKADHMRSSWGGHCELWLSLGKV